MSETYSIQPIISGQVLDATNHRTNFTNFASIYNYHDKNKNGVHGIAQSEEITSVQYCIDLFNDMFPVGSIIETWDNEIVLVKELIDTNYLVELDGSVVNDVESVFNGITLPDSSEAYLLITLSSSVLPAAIYSSNTLNISHNHSYYHYHEFNHDHPGVSHSHSTIYGWLNMYLDTANKRLYYGQYDSDIWTTDERAGNWSDYNDGYYNGAARIPGFDGIVGTVSSGTYSSNTTDTTSYDTNTYTLIDTVNIKLDSIKCRRYLRIK